MSTTQATISRMIRTEFNNTNYWEIQKINELILTAQSYGLDEEVKRMRNDLKN